ncbi:MAG: leucine-rich repeat protein [Clostridium sp.]
MSKLLTYPVRKKEETYKIPNLVTSIENSAFNTCTYLKSIEIPNSVTDIGDLAFESCISLTNINIPNSVIEIGDSAFNNCRELKKIEIPNSVVKIGKCGFSLCKNLTEIKMSNSLTSIEYGTFAYCKNLKEIIISESITNIGIGAFYECSNLESINIPNSVTNIDEEAFFNCDKLTINGYKDSYAETYAKEHSIPFKEIQELEIITSINNFTADKKSPQISGTVIKLSVEAAGKGTLQYKFIIKDNKTGNWAKLRDYGTNNTYIWKTKATGDKTLYVDVKDEKGQVIRKSLGYTVQEKVSAPVIKSFVSDKKSPQISGASIKLSVEAIGTGILQYKFIIKDNKTGNWYKLRDYNTSNVYLWTTKQTGNKTLYVDVKDSNGQVTRKSMNYIVK